VVFAACLFRIAGFPPLEFRVTMKPLVGIVMGSQSDWETMRAAAEILEQLGVAHEVRVVSAHRTPDLLFEYASSARTRGLEAIIAGAGGAAHLPGMTASKTSLPVLGVPVQSKTLNGLDSLLSIVQMPAGVPVATFAIGVAGAKNAALFACSILASKYPEIGAALEKFRSQQTDAVLQNPDPSSPLASPLASAAPASAPPRKS
jgi:5-(carboxyamino)imidazole ribonucleotide mutase